MTNDPEYTLIVSHAERAIVGIAVRKPRVWKQICHIRPEWFRTWNMQTIWRGLLHCYDLNGGLAELCVLTDWFKQNCDESEIEGLLQELVSCADEYLHAEFLEYFLGLLEHAGIRLAIERWAGHLVEMNRAGRPLKDLIEAVLSPPISERGAA